MSFQIRLAETSLSFPCRHDQNVLAAMGQAGRDCVQVGCRGGGCGVCRVQVTEGRFETGTMSGAQITPADRQRDIVLACQLFPRSDLSVRVLGRTVDSGNDPTARLLRAYTGRAALTRTPAR